MGGPMAIKRVKVFCPSKHICVVEKVHVRPGDKVVWVNQTGAQIDILVPAHKLTSAHFIQQGRGTMPSKSAITILNVRVDPRRPRSYYYAIYSHKVKNFAYGGSSPEMIVP
jgi:hypothetical protein